MIKNFKETSRSGAIIWFFQRISAIILFVLLLLHYVGYHFISDGTIKYNEIVAKMQSPWFTLVQFIFLITALYHGINGIWMVAEDYMKNKFTRLTVFSLLIFLGLVLFFIGMHTIFKVGNL